MAMRARAGVAVLFAAVLLASGCGKDELKKTEASPWVSKEVLDFGSVFLFEEATQTFVLENRGGRPLSFEKLGLPDDFQLIPERGTVGPFRSRELVVTFAPKMEGLQEGVLELRTSGEPETLEVQIRGRGFHSPFHSVESLDFGTVRVGSRFTKKLMVEEMSGESRHVVVGGSGEVGSFSWAPREFMLSGYEKREIEVTFAPVALEREQTATLYISCVGDCPSRGVKLVGGAALPVLKSTPSLVAFGKVPAETTEVREVTLRNAGEVETGELSLRFAEETASISFSPEELPSLEPGEEASIVVRFESTRSAGRRAAVLHAYNDVGRIPFELPIEGWSGSTSLEPNPSEVHVVAPVGWTALQEFNRYAQTLTIRNIAPPERLSVSHKIDEGGPSPFEVTYPDGNEIEGNEPLALLVHFFPEREGKHSATLHLVAGDAELSLPLHGTGNLPLADCPEGGEVWPNEEVALPGGDASLLGDAECMWRIADAPVEGSGTIEDAKDCTTSFIPGVVGRYQVELETFDSVGNTSTCLVDFDVQPRHGLWVETFWDEPSDVDLRLLNLEKGDVDEPESWNSHIATCHYANCTPDRLDLPWGSDRSGWPSLDRDDKRGRGPENIFIDAPNASGYAVGVHWFESRDAQSTKVTTKIYCDTKLVGSAETTLESSKEFHVLGEIDFVGKDCVFTERFIRWEGF